MLLSKTRRFSQRWGLLLNPQGLLGVCCRSKRGCAEVSPSTAWGDSPHSHWVWKAGARTRINHTLLLDFTTITDPSSHLPCWTAAWTPVLLPPHPPTRAPAARLPILNRVFLLPCDFQVLSPGCVFCPVHEPDTELPPALGRLFIVSYRVLHPWQWLTPPPLPPVLSPTPPQTSGMESFAHRSSGDDRI